jgi:hypothetical protein
MKGTTSYIKSSNEVDIFENKGYFKIIAFQEW